MYLSKVRVIAAALGLAVAALVGCSQSSGVGPDGELLPSATLYERDIPVPIGFKLVEDACEDQSTGTRRLYLRHTYEGRASEKYLVRNFYREQMPRARWSLVSNRNVEGTYTLRFEKGSEACTVTITDTGRKFGSNARIEVVVVQEERGTPAGEPRNQR